MPDIEPCSYLIDLLFEIGPCKVGFAGAIAIDWSDLYAWTQLTKYELTPWESRMIVRLSRVYAESTSEYRNPNASAPFTQITDDQKIKDHSEKVASAFRTFGQLLDAQKKKGSGNARIIKSGHKG